MTTVTLITKQNPDGTITYTVKCGLEEVHDINGEIIDNPIQTLYWSEEQQRYVLYLDPPQDNTPFPPPLHDDIIAHVDVVAPTTAPSSDKLDNEDTLLARECWCARIFYNGYGKFDNRYDDDNSSSILDIPKNPLFCPIDTNTDGSMTDRDVKVCTARAIIDVAKETILAQESICYQEDALSEFSKSAWPLCFFWWIILFYILWGTQYGRRVRGYVWRTTCLQAGKLSKERRNERNETNETNTNNATGDNSNEDRNGEIVTPTQNGENPQSAQGSDEEQGNVESTSEPPSSSARNNEDDVEFTPDELETIRREFGSLQNYNLLDHELRYQAEHTDNEFVTWLWYSAVYTEVRRYRYEQWVARRERQRRRRRQELAGANQAAFNGDEDEMSSDEEVDLMRGRRLDSVFWWPPASPDGMRWEHVRNQNRNNSQDEDGNPIDVGRLRLKTKRFTLSSDVETNDNNSNPLDEESNTRNTESTQATTVTTNSNDNNIHDEDEFDLEVYENTCSICLCELQEGDLVGDIPCGHFFHKDCLKEWLVKNNHCPVCRMPNIACHPLQEQGQSP